MKMHTSIFRTFLLSIPVFCGITSVSARNPTIIPMGGERYQAGEKVSFFVPDSLKGKAYSIHLWDGNSGEWSPISFMERSGKLEWIIPSSLNGSSFRMRLESGNTSLISNGYFAIHSPLLGISRSVPVIHDRSLDISPNPAADFIKLVAKGKGLKSAAVFDIRGGEVLRMDLKNGDRLPVSSLRAGNYYIKVEAENGEVLTNKFVIDR